MPCGVDTIVEEVRGNRAAYAARFNHDIKAICHAAREEQSKSPHEIVSLPPRRVCDDHEPRCSTGCTSGDRRYTRRRTAGRVSAVPPITPQRVRRSIPIDHVSAPA